MHEGGVDTHASAKAAGDQAQAALDMATAAGDQVDAGNNFSDSAEEINRGVTGAVGQLKAAANNTRAGIDATKESLQLDQRAWVGVDDVSGVPKLDEFVIDVAIKNTGRTPAREVESLNTYNPVNKGDSPSFQYALLPAKASRAMIPPNSTYHVHPPPPELKVTQTDLDRIKNEDVTLYVFGKTTYRDVFSCGHWLTYCCHLLRNAKEWAACDQYNDTGDDSCPAKKPN